MKTLLVIEEAQYQVRRATVIAKGNDDLNRLSVCYNGIQGYINRSGAILCREIEAEKIMAKEQEVSALMCAQFPEYFTGLYIANTDDLSNPAKQAKRDSYFKH